MRTEIAAEGGAFSSNQPLGAGQIQQTIPRTRTRRGIVCQRAWAATVSVLVRNLEVPTHCSSIAREGNLMFHRAMNVIVTPSCSQEDGVASLLLRFRDDSLDKWRAVRRAEAGYIIPSWSGRQR